MEEAGIRDRGRGVWPAAWSWIDLFKPTSITKGKERELPVAYIYSIFWESHLKRLGSWTPSNDHDLVNLWDFFFTVALSDLINIPRLVYLSLLYYWM